MSDAPKGLVIGIANEDSIAWACAKAFHDSGARLIVTYQNEQTRRTVEGLAARIDAEHVLPLDVTDVTQMDAVFLLLQKIGAALIFSFTRLLPSRQATCSTT